MFGISPLQLLICGVVAVLLFGKRLPAVARSAGKSLTEFRRGMQDLQDEFRGAMHEAERAANEPPQLTQARGSATADESVEQDEESSESAAAEDEDPALVGGYPDPTRPPYEAS